VPKNNWDEAESELLDLVGILLEESVGPQAMPWWSEELPPVMPGTWPISQLKRLLDLAVKHRKYYAYTRILQVWLTNEGMVVPNGIFKRDIYAPGSGRKPSANHSKLRAKAWPRQLELIKARAGGLSEPELARRVLETPLGFKSSQIAKELLPREYAAGGQKRDAARKLVKEVIAETKPTPDGLIGALLGGPMRLSEVLDRLLSGKPPFEPEK
jgi:hypothetical protein